MKNSTGVSACIGLFTGSPAMSSIFRSYRIFIIALGIMTISQMKGLNAEKQPRLLEILEDPTIGRSDKNTFLLAAWMSQERIEPDTAQALLTLLKEGDLELMVGIAGLLVKKGYHIKTFDLLLELIETGGVYPERCLMAFESALQAKDDAPPGYFGDDEFRRKRIVNKFLQTVALTEGNSLIDFMIKAWAVSRGDVVNSSVSQIGWEEPGLLLDLLIKIISSKNGQGPKVGLTLLIGTDAKYLLREQHLRRLIELTEDPDEVVNQIAREILSKVIHHTVATEHVTGDESVSWRKWWEVCGSEVSIINSAIRIAADDKKDFADERYFAIKQLFLDYLSPEDFIKAHSCLERLLDAREDLRVRVSALSRLIGSKKIRQDANLLARTANIMLKILREESQGDIKIRQWVLSQFYNFKGAVRLPDVYDQLLAALQNPNNDELSRGFAAFSLCDTMRKKEVALSIVQFLKEIDMQHVTEETERARHLAINALCNISGQYFGPDNVAHWETWLQNLRE